MDEEKLAGIEARIREGCGVILCDCVDEDLLALVTEVRALRVIAENLQKALVQGEEVSGTECRVYWGSHGCGLGRGHDEPHVCWCCECDEHPDPPDKWGAVCVGAPPYYGLGTCFSGEDSADA